MNENPVILIVEDEEAISNFLSAILESNHYKVIKTQKGQEAISLAASRCPDLVLLDLGLPDMDGIEVIKKIRAWSGVPIVVVSARGHEREKVEALDLGVDDYITKPFGTSELLARVRTEIRHSQKKRSENWSEPQKVEAGDLLVDLEKRQVSRKGEKIHLTPIEYKIISILAIHIGKVLTHEYICREIWGPHVSEVQALRVNMANIRRKLEDNPAEPQYIITEVGVGYRMVDIQ